MRIRIVKYQPDITGSQQIQLYGLFRKADIIVKSFNKLSSASFEWQAINYLATVFGLESWISTYLPAIYFSCKLFFIISKFRAIYTKRVKIYYGIWWLKKELSMVHGTLHFFRNKTFLFAKIESWNFQQLFDLGFRETVQNFSSFRQTFRWQTKKFYS